MFRINSQTLAEVSIKYDLKFEKNVAGGETPTTSSG